MSVDLVDGQMTLDDVLEPDVFALTPDNFVGFVVAGNPPVVTVSWVGQNFRLWDFATREQAEAHAARAFRWQVESHPFLVGKAAQGDPAAVQRRTSRGVATASVNEQVLS